MTFEDILGAVARGWGYEKNQHKCMDVDLAIAIAKEVHALHQATTAPYVECHSKSIVDVIADPVEIRRVFELDDAQMPPPESGFAKL